MRAKKPIVIIDAYYDGEGQALCPAATGITHHINPWGDIEPCPIVQFTQGVDPRDEGRPAAAAARSSCSRRSCATSASWPQQTTRGCIVLERPDLLKQLVEKHGAKDATARQTALAELAAMTVRTSQYNPAARDPGEELALPAGEAVLVQRLRRLRRPRRAARASLRPGRSGEVGRTESNSELHTRLNFAFSFFV